MSPVLDQTLRTDLPNVLKVIDGCSKTPKCDFAKAATQDSNVDIRVTKGALTTTNLTHKKWRFEDEEPATSRWLAQELCWTFSIDETALRLAIPGLGEVSVAHFANVAAIEIRLQNTLEADLLPSMPKDATVDEHVKLFYDLSVQKPNKVQKLKAVAGWNPDALPTHIHHLLDGDRIARARKVLRTVRTIRINCPPALWTGP